MDDGHGRLGIDVFLAIPLSNRLRLLLSDSSLGEVGVQSLQTSKQLGMSLLVLALQTTLPNQITWKKEAHTSSPRLATLGGSNELAFLTKDVNRIIRS